MDPLEYSELCEEARATGYYSKAGVYTTVEDALKAASGAPDAPEPLYCVREATDEDLEQYKYIPGCT